MKKLILLLLLVVFCLCSNQPKLYIGHINFNCKKCGTLITNSAPISCDIICLVYCPRCLYGYIALPADKFKLAEKE